MNGYKVDDIENNKIIIGDTTQVIEQIVLNEEIESIVTKEQFAGIEYRLEKNKMKEDISKEIETIVNYCRLRECEECPYDGESDMCDLHNPSTWNV